MQKAPRTSPWRPLLLLMLVLALVATACGGDDDESTETTAAGGEADTETTTTQAAAETGGEIVIAIGSEPSTLDPHLRDDGGERAVNDNIYETLLARDSQGQLEPSLATSLPTQVDDTTWEVTIRDGVSFTNGNPLDAAAVVASFERLTGLGDESEQSGFFGSIASVEAVDDMTVRFTTDGPDPILPAKLYWLKVIDASEVAEGFDENPVGTGPYQFVSWDRGSSVVLERNPNYWGDAPAIDKVTFRFIEESGTRLSGLLSGEFDLITNLSPDDAGVAPKAESVVGLEHPIMILSTIDGPTADPKVRQAMNYAIDKQALADALYGGAAAVDQCQILSSTVFGFNPDLAPYEYDPDKARQLIAEAGAEGVTIEVVGESGRWLKDRELIEAVANYWAEVGLNPDVQIFEFGEYLNRLFDRETRAAAIFVSSSNDLLDPSRQLGTYYSPEGIGSSNQDPEMLDWVTQAAVETDTAVREDLYHQATARACDDAYFAFLLNIEDSYGTSERLVWQPRVDARLLVKEMSLGG
ncbi:MAG: ABC transporter substrate-binding protein [Acidimicrobiia bacterium]|nr:ABC transporter substrate-binding protein [Acidimicrobiia bacterium]